MYLDKHRQLELPSEVAPRLLQTIVVEVVQSNTGMHITSEEMAFTTTNLYNTVLPTHLALRDSHSQPQPQQLQSQSPSQSEPVQEFTTSTTITHTLPTTSNQRVTSHSLTTTSQSHTTPTSTSTFGTTTTIVTITRAHHPDATSIQTSYIEEWPQIGSIPRASDIPAQWRETYEMKAQQQQYVALGAICGIFVVGVLGVLGCAVWRCGKEGKTGRREDGGEEEGRWDWW